MCGARSCVEPFSQQIHEHVQRIVSTSNCHDPRGAEHGQDTNVWCKKVIGAGVKTGIYKKVGRRYVEVGEYDPEFMDHISNGATLIVKRKSCTSRYFNVDPDIVPMLAAGKYCEDEISAALVKAGELRMQRSDRERKMTPGQRAAWENLVAEFGDSARQLEWPSARECAEAGAKAMQEEAQKLLANESIKAAYEHFLLLCKLSAQNTPAEPA
jgi:hypothetical protein